VDVAAEGEAAEVLEELIVEQRLAVVAGEGGEVVEIAEVEAERLEVLEGRLQSAGDREAPAEGVLPEGEREARLLPRRAGLEVAERHRELVEIRQQRQRWAVGAPRAKASVGL
jgi:hypothetical protein